MRTKALILAISVTFFLVNSVLSTSLAQNKSQDSEPEPRQIGANSTIVGGESGGTTDTENLDINLGGDLERQGVEERLVANGVNLLGDQIDMDTGALRFEHVDVSLPGNSDLEVAIRREREQGRKYNHKFQGDFGDWQINTPRITYITAVPLTNSDVSPTSVSWQSGCSSPREGGIIVEPEFAVTNPVRAEMIVDFNTIADYSYSSGIDLQIPGSGSQQVLHLDDDLPVERNFPAWPADAVKGTSAGWAITCIQNIGRDNEEGFIAHAPNGDQYRFDRIIYREAPLDNNARQILRFLRYYAIVLATEVTDVHGNWVKYTYNDRGDLTKIHSNDGRKIDLYYEGEPLRSGVLSSDSKRISRIEANGRTWEYEYHQNNLFFWLKKATLPDGRYWQIGGNAGLWRMDKNALASTICTQNPITIGLVHPNGISGSFTLNEIGHGLTYANPGGGSYHCQTADIGDIEAARPVTEVMSLVQKTLSGPGYPDATWNYNYFSDQGAFHNSGGLPDTRYTRVIDPLGHVTHYHHNRRGDSALQGQLVKIERFENASTATPVETTENNFTVEDPIGWSFLSNSNLERLTRPVYRSETITTRDGNIHRTRFTYNSDQSSADYSFGNPTKIERFAIPDGQTRVEETTYEHHKSLNQWMIGLPKKSTRNGKIFDEYTYDSKGRVVFHDRFGVRYARYVYFGQGHAAAGQVFRQFDGLNRLTQFNGYKRGQPTLITRADGTTLRRTVDDNGWVTSETNARGYRTNYAYNAMGWLTNIDRPENWADTSINYAFLNDGTLRQRSTTNNERTIIFYDGLNRQMRVSRVDLNDAGRTITSHTQYDPLGRETLKTYPSYFAASMRGIETQYDALNRVIQTRETESPFATTIMEYLSGARMRVTDPSGAQTTTSYRRYGNPDDGDVVRIVQPEGVITDMTYDHYSNILSATQHGTSNGYNVTESKRYRYDQRLRLCSESTEEAGATRYRYNNANELIRYSKGHARDREFVNANASNLYDRCFGLTPTALVEYIYDNLGRKTQVNYPDNTGDIVMAYDANSNLTSVTKGSGSTLSNWVFTYNSADLPYTETLTVDGRIYKTANWYNPSGHLTYRQYPGGPGGQGGMTVAYRPDGFGRAKEIQGEQLFLSSVDWHASGALANATYGNGQRLVRSENPRQLLSRIFVAKGGAKVLDNSYAYDARGLITSITPNITGVGFAHRTAQSFTYDGLARLISATGPWGGIGNLVNAAYQYDALGNIRVRQLGGRSIFINYNFLNQVRSVRDNNYGNQFRNYTHDSRGNIISDTRLNFTYDRAERPVAITGIGPSGASTTGTYTYDGFNRRVRQTVDGVTIYSVYTQSGELIHRDNVNTGQKTDYINLAGASLRLVNNQATYTHKDHLGSPIAATNGTGAVLWREIYRPYGEKVNGAVQNSGAANAENESFTGHIDDTSLGLTYMQARYYDPAIGRFLSNDPMSFMGSGYSPAYFNRYAYTANNPVNNIDPDGGVFRAAVSAFKVAKRTVKARGNVFKAVRDEAASIADAGGTLFDPNASGIEKAAAVFEVAVGVKVPGVGKKGGNPCCFVADTLVETEAGLRPIENMKVGDKVWAHDPETGETALKEVTDFIPAHDREIWRVAVKGDTSSEVFETTHEHPWWVIDGDGKGAWKETHELKPEMRVIARGDLEEPRLILASTGNAGTISPDRIMMIASVENTGRIDATYNITVADFHTYFVGTQRVLVHNCKPVQGPANPGATKNVSDLNGKSSSEANQALSKAGFENKGTSSGGFTTHKHSDGSKMTIKPNGTVIRNGPRTNVQSATGKKFNPRFDNTGRRTENHNPPEKIDN